LDVKKIEKKKVTASLPVCSAEKKGEKINAESEEKGSPFQIGKEKSRGEKSLQKKQLATN